VCLPPFLMKLLVCAGSQAHTDGCQVAASVTVDALYVAMMDSKQCRHLLEGTQTGDRMQGLTSAIRSLDGHLTAQLNASACLAHMLTQVRFIANCNVTGSHSHISLTKIEYCPCSPPLKKI